MIAKTLSTQVLKVSNVVCAIEVDSKEIACLTIIRLWIIIGKCEIEYEKMNGKVRKLFRT